MEEDHWESQYPRPLMSVVWKSVLFLFLTRHVFTLENNHNTPTCSNKSHTAPPTEQWLMQLPKCVWITHLCVLLAPDTLAEWAHPACSASPVPSLPRWSRAQHSATRSTQTTVCNNLTQKRSGVGISVWRRKIWWPHQLTDNEFINLHRKQRTGAILWPYVLC